uniref:Cytochrome c oxidase assembly factor 6 n=1 Tax=Araucaria cunninghamii TaxID=56994 RepID=A0A0D6R782_ARACU
MGWWTKKESADEQDSDDIHKDVLAAGREACYKARDMFYACVEKKSDKKPTEVASVGLLYPAECKRARADFVKQCRPTWVKHFDRQYCAKKRVERLLESQGSRKGPMSLPQPSTFKQ